MSRKSIRALINRADAEKSTGPRTKQGKQRTALNAFKHNLSGQHLVLVEHEFDAYHDACERALRDYKPHTEMERQIAQKIIDINFRLNRITSLETNMFNLDTVHAATDMYDDDRTEIMCAQTRAWKNESHHFDLLGRYEARLSKQLLQYQKELERLQTLRKAEAEELRQQQKNEALNPDLASFGNTPSTLVMKAAPALENHSHYCVIDNCDGHEHEYAHAPAQLTPPQPAA